LSGRGLCDELITRPEESYRLCCVVVCDLETSRICAPYIYDISSLRVNLHFRGFLSCTNTKFDAVLPKKQTVASFSYHLVWFVAMLSLLFRCVCFENPDSSPSRQTVSGGRTPHRYLGIVLGSVFR